MWRSTRRKSGFAVLTMLLASGVTGAALAQINVVPISPEEIEVQVRQAWRDGEATCEKFNQTKIERVDILSSDEFKSWLMTRHSLYGDGMELFPRGNYVRVASSAENIGDGITVFGPVYATLKSMDFHSIVGLPICNYRAQKPTATRLKEGE